MSLERIVSPSISDLNDVIEFEKALANGLGSMHGPLGDYFDAKHPIFIVRAPARLDCMGGIADYSGATVCELPLDRAVVLAIQGRRDRQVVIHSHGIDRDGLSPDVTLSLDTQGSSKRAIRYGRIREAFSETPGTSWAGYVAGIFPVLLKEGILDKVPHGATIVFTSNIPLGSGISSSAAVEIATVLGVNLLYDLNLEGLELARLAQIVENNIVGAPCGIMDQVTSVLGREGEFLCLHCQPHDIKQHLPLPKDFHVIGMNSNVKHHVGGAQYTSVRVGAFMGLGMILAHLRKTAGLCKQDDPFGGYLCNIPPQEFDAGYRMNLPKSITGRTFLNRYGETPDPVTTVQSEQSYMVRSRVEHPIYEHARVQKFIGLLESSHRTGLDVFLEMAGKLMYASDWSYAHRCGLGAPETAWIVREVRKLGPNAGFYGAKITGGGAGGTVAIAGNSRMFDHLEQLVVRYTNATGLKADLFTGTSPGALQFGHGVFRKN